jgi:hypothetical protein
VGAVRPLLLFLALASMAACGSSSETSTAPSQIRCGVDARADVTAFNPDGGTGIVRITTARECAWSARSEAGWLTLSPPTSGQGDAEVAFRVAGNSEPVSRLAGITVADQRVQVSQDARPCAYQLPSTLEPVGAAGGERTVQIGASSGQCRWTAVSDVPWIGFASAREGSGNGSVTVTIDPLTGPQRVGSVTIAGHVVTITQSPTQSPTPPPPTPPSPTPPPPSPPCAATVEPAAYAAPTSGGPATFSVQSTVGCAWTASSPVDWIVVTAGQAGSGPGEVRVMVAANAGPGRTAALAIAGQTVTVTQATGCSVTLSPPSVSVGAEGSAGVVQVATAAGCSWSTTSSAAWIAVTAGASGSGTGEVRFSVGGNSGPARAGSLSIGGRAVTISQASGCAYAIAPMAQDVPGAGASVPVSVTTAAGCPWTASSDASWIAMAPGAGTGPGQISLTVAPNQGPARTTTASLAGQTFTVRQASPCTWSFVPPSHLFDANGGNGAILVLVTGPCTWTAASNVGWATVTTGASGVGSGLVQFVAAPNTGAARTGTLTIGGERYEIVQTGK